MSQQMKIDFCIIGINNNFFLVFRLDHYILH